MSRRAAPLGVVLTVCLVGCAEQQGAHEEGAAAPPNTGVRYLAGDAAEGFARAEEPIEFVFPRDHGSHPEFQTEWWYFTGNLQGDDASHYGFELTFFRVALAPQAPASESRWATNQFWMAHFAITDADGGEFFAAERTSRGALGLAGANVSPLEIRVEDWAATGALEGPGASVRLQAASDQVALDVVLEPLKPPVLQGDRGLDKKGPESGNASYYYSITRLDAQGSLRIGERERNVDGSAWMDREWSTSALSPGIAGWDWFALQLSDGRDLMYYRLRGEDGSTSPFSGGTLVDAEGNARRLGPSDVSLEALGYWRSEATGVEYPVRWRLTVPSEALELEVSPYLEAQEIDLLVRYWEGAVRAAGRRGNESIEGRGYLELAGYEAPLPARR